MQVKNKGLFIFVLIISVALSYFVGSYYLGVQEAKRKQWLLKKRKAAWSRLDKEIRDQINRFKGEAGIVIKDLDSNWEFAYNKEELFPSASLAKIPIMAGCFQASEEGKFKLSDNIKLKSSDKLSGSGILKNMTPGAGFTVEGLIGLMIYNSDNTATSMLTNMLGLAYLNKFFREIGLQNSNLSRKIADYRSRSKGVENYTTAEDMAHILEKIYNRELVTKGISEKCLNLLKLQKVNDRIPKYLPVEITIAHKTGLERSVCHDVGIVYTCRGNFIICVLTKHKNSNSILSKEFIAKVSLSVYNYFEGL